MNDDLINLDDDGRIAPKSTTSVTGGNGLIGKMTLTDKRARPLHKDSFADLTGLMRVKKLYTPIPAPAPRSPSLSVSPNDPHFASRPTPDSSILAPLAKPYKAPESVAAFLQAQQELMDPAFFPSEATPQDCPENVNIFDSITQAILEHNSEDDSECDHRRRKRCPSPHCEEPLLISGLEPPTRVGPIQPPTPAEPLQISPFGFRSDQEAVVQVTKKTWEALENELDTIKAQKKELEDQLSTVERSYAILKDVDHDIGQQLGKLKFQNEANKSQKAEMGRSLSEKEMQIKKQKHEIDSLVRKLGAAKAKFKNVGNGANDTDYLRGIKVERDLANLAAIKDREIADLKRTIKERERAVSDLAATKDRELRKANVIIREREQTIDSLTRQRDAARSSQVHSGDHLSRERSLAEALAQRENVLAGLREQLVAERVKVAKLENELEVMEAESNQANSSNLKSKLRETISTCDRQQKQFKMFEADLKLHKDQLAQVAKYGERLRGAAHMVMPGDDVKLPQTVISCLECYAKNLPCDNGSTCRNCSENNTACKRWMCSLKHKYGNCPLAPCLLTHDPQGWLMSPQPRPEW